MKSAGQNVAGLAFRFVLIVGIVNFFADMTYEGGRAIVGPFLGSLGASAAIVGFVAGFGELAGYALRSVSGYFADKTRRYWAGGADHFFGRITVGRLARFRVSEPAPAGAGLACKLSLVTCLCAAPLCDLCG